MEGYISIQRKIKEHWVFERDDYFKAWIVLLMEVNHKERKVLVKGKAITCEVGQSLKSIDSWVAAFGNGWTRQKVRTFFKILESDKMIKTEPIFKTTTKLTICNYGDYQSKQPTANQGATKEQPTANQGATTNNNENNENNENKEIISWGDFKKHGFDKLTELGLNPVQYEFSLKAKYEQWQENDWRDGFDNKIVNWKSKLTNQIKYGHIKKMGNNGKKKLSF
jgi:DNA replication protein DnaD